MTPFENACMVTDKKGKLGNGFSCTFINQILQNYASTLHFAAQVTLMTAQTE